MFKISLWPVLLFGLLSISVHWFLESVDDLSSLEITDVWSSFWKSSESFVARRAAIPKLEISESAEEEYPIVPEEPTKTEPLVLIEEVDEEPSSQASEWSQGSGTDVETDSAVQVEADPSTVNASSQSREKIIEYPFVQQRKPQEISSMSDKAPIRNVQVSMKSSVLNLDFGATKLGKRYRISIKKFRQQKSSFNGFLN